jgi:hypothetical protein
MNKISSTHVDFSYLIFSTALIKMKNKKGKKEKRKKKRKEKKKEKKKKN